MVADKEFMRECIRLSEKAMLAGELPFSSIIVRNNKIIVRAINKTKKFNDVTRHAEIIAMQKAQKLLNTQDLSDCIIYASTEPCAMCSFMIRELRFKKVVFGLPSPFMGGYSKFKVLQDKDLETLKIAYDKPPEIITGLLQVEARVVWDEWEKQGHGADCKCWDNTNNSPIFD